MTPQSSSLAVIASSTRTTSSYLNASSTAWASPAGPVTRETPLDARFGGLGGDQGAAGPEFALDPVGGQRVPDGGPSRPRRHRLPDRAGRGEPPASIPVYPDGDGTEPGGTEPADDGQRRGGRHL